MDVRVLVVALDVVHAHGVLQARDGGRVPQVALALRAVVVLPADVEQRAWRS